MIDAAPCPANESLVSTFVSSVESLPAADAWRLLTKTREALEPLVEKAILHAIRGLLPKADTVRIECSQGFDDFGMAYTTYERAYLTVEGRTIALPPQWKIEEGDTWGLVCIDDVEVPADGSDNWWEDCARPVLAKALNVEPEDVETLVFLTGDLARLHGDSDEYTLPPPDQSWNASDTAGT